MSTRSEELAYEIVDAIREGGASLSTSDYVEYLEEITSSLQADIDAAKDDLRRAERSSGEATEGEQ